MKRLLLSLRFIGTGYHGWQVQDNACTVQGEVQNALERLLGSRPAVTGCSRTDSGVHANQFCCHFDTGKNLPPETIVRALNHYLPLDIGAVACREVSGHFHARYSCCSKEYVYKIYHSSVRDPFWEGRAFLTGGPLHENWMNAAAAAFLGAHDFKAFCAAGAKPGDTVRTVKHIRVEREGAFVNLIVEADGFLYNMVRIMAGTLLEVGRGKIPPQKVSEILEGKDRGQAGPTAPAHGLYLNRVVYSFDDEGTRKADFHG